MIENLECWRIFSICLESCYDSSTTVAWTTGSNSRVGVESHSTRNWTLGMVLTIWTTWTVGNRPVSPRKTQHFKFIILAPIEYLSSDLIITWLVCTLHSIGRSWITCGQICDRTNIHWVVIYNTRISHTLWWYFTVTPQILVGSQIWKRKVEQWLKLHNLRIDHVMIHWDLRYIIGVKVAATIKWNHGSGYNPAKKPWVYVCPG